MRQCEELLRPRKLGQNGISAGIETDYGGGRSALARWLRLPASNQSQARKNWQAADQNFARAPIKAPRPAVPKPAAV